MGGFRNKGLTFAPIIEIQSSVFKFGVEIKISMPYYSQVTRKSSPTQGGITFPGGGGV